MYLLIILLLIAIIPAKIASDKGHSFVLWYIYGVLLWIVAFIHALCLNDESYNSMDYQRELNYKKELEIKRLQNETDNKRKIEDSKPDLILKYKKLLDDGIITQEEFDIKKRQLLEM